MRLSKLFQKTLLAMFLLFGVISITSSLLAAWILYEHMTEEFESKGMAITRSIVNASVEVLLNRDASTVQAMIDQYLEMQGTAYVFVQDSEGKIISHTFVPAVPESVLTLPRDPRQRRITKLTVPGHGKILDIAEPILAGVAGYVHVGMDLGMVHSYIWAAVFKMQVLMFFIFWSSVGLLYLVIKRISQPLNQLTEYARSLAAHDFSATVSIDSKDEIGLLAQTMETMSAELSELIAGLEKAVTNATLELNDNLDYTSAIIDNMADGLLVVDTRGVVTRANPALSVLFGYGDAPLTDKNLRLHFPLELSELVNQAIANPREVFSLEIPMARRRTGKAVATTILRSSFEEDEPSPGDGVLGVVILVRDITTEKHVDSMKTEFISTVSHELRTPLTSVLGFAKIIQKRLNSVLMPQLDLNDKTVARAVDQINENMDIIINEGQRLTELINDVLDISKMESGKTEWRTDPVDIGEVMAHSAAGAEALVQEQGLELRVEADPELPMIHGDRNRLVQVLVNLISNAVKFTAQGTITCKAERSNGAILVSVADTGVGISPADRDVIFERFRQSGDTMTEKPKGTGLGLPICKQIIEHHRGAIWMQSKPGKGSTFFFTLPLQLPDEDIPPPLMHSPAAQASARASAQGADPAHSPPCDPGSDECLVMVVDDDPPIRSYLEQVLQGEGYRTISAKDGPEALQLARTTLPDCITMDLMMPGMDGNTVIRHLRSDPLTQHIPVVVVSAFPDFDAGNGDATLVKPVDEERLVETIHSLLLDNAGMLEGCLVVSRHDDGPQHRLFRICSKQAEYCRPEHVFERIEKGFSGALFIPSDIAETVDLSELSTYKEVVTIIVPT